MFFGAPKTNNKKHDFFQLMPTDKMKYINQKRHQIVHAPEDQFRYPPTKSS